MDVRGLIASIDERTGEQEHRLLAGLFGDLWPGGPHDQHRPRAAEWVRRWGPALDHRPPRDGSPN